MYDIVIIGGGLAGLTSALDLQARGYQVCLIEKNQYPFHKVCGEFISSEVLPYLIKLGIDISILNPTTITHFRLTSPNGNQITSKLPVPSIGVSRYKLDDYLVQLARQRGIEVRDKTNVEDVLFNDNRHEVKLSGGGNLRAKIVIGSFGKRSVLDRKLNRKFFTARSPYVGVKYHMNYDTPEELVNLHNFKGGYCGVSMVEDKKVNICYLTTRSNLKEWGNISALEQNVLYKNPFLRDVFEKGEHLFENPKVINEISFAPKKVVVDHILMAGDAAGMIPPFSGNGMAMAIHSSYILCGLIDEYFRGKLSRTTLEKIYETEWESRFKNRLFFGRTFQPLFGKEIVSDTSLIILKLFPFLVPIIAKQIHKKPFLQDVKYAIRTGRMAR